MTNPTDSLVHELEESAQNKRPSPLTSLRSSSSSFSLIDTSSEESSEITTIANAIILAEHPPSPESNFRISKPPSPRLQLTPDFQQNLISNAIDYHPTFVFMRENKSEENEDKEQDDFVTKGLITLWNSQVGNSENSKKAQKLIKKMRKLGGLDPSGSPIDIPSARIGLCLLAGLDNQDNKMSALNSLLAILKNDNYSNANSIVTLAIKLLPLMDREVIQAVDLEAQNTIAEVYNVLAETLHHYYGKGHINAITKELKNELYSAAKSLEKLNRHEDIKLKFNVHCALEGVHRLKDDCQELFDLVERIYNLLVSATALYMEQPQEGFERLERVFKDIHPHLPNSWYNAILVLKNLARDVKDKPEQLTPLLMLIGKKHKKLNWKFAYAALEILFNLTLNGENKHVRLRAFNGIKQFGSDFPGFAYFATYTELGSYASAKPMIHWEKPQQIDPNIRIRQACIQGLIELVEKSQDDIIVKKARLILKQRAGKESC